LSDFQSVQHAFSLNSRVSPLSFGPGAFNELSRGLSDKLTCYFGPGAFNELTRSLSDNYLAVFKSCSLFDTSLAVFKSCSLFDSDLVLSTSLPGACPICQHTFSLNSRVSPLSFQTLCPTEKVYLVTGLPTPKHTSLPPWSYPPHVSDRGPSQTKLTRTLQEQVDKNCSYEQIYYQIGTAKRLTYLPKSIHS